MKLMIASDLHGSLYYCKMLEELCWRERADRLILLGDLLYHGPRNDLPKDYSPKEVIPILNGMKDKLLCVRGNCDSEVDQTVLEFPILAEYMVLFLDGRAVFATHGHVFSGDNLPAMKEGDIFLQGHTHLQAMENRGNYIYLNPGSIAMPKGNDDNSYMVYENGIFILKDLMQREIQRMELD